MKKKEKKEVLEVIEQEGFEYAFLHYTDFADIEDEKFHDLRKEFIKAAQKLTVYIGYNPHAGSL